MGAGGEWERAGCSKCLVRGAVANIVRQVLHVHVTLTWDVNANGIHPRRGRGKSQRGGYPTKAGICGVLPTCESISIEVRRGSLLLSYVGRVRNGKGGKGNLKVMDGIVIRETI